MKSIRFTTKTNHDSLKWILNVTVSNAGIARWRLRLPEIEIDVLHRVEIRHQVADAQSQLPTTGESRKPFENDLPIPAINVIENEREICVIDANCEKVQSLRAQPPLGNNLPQSQ